MIKFDELNPGISYSDPLLNFPDHFNEESLRKIESVFRKWDNLKEEFTAIEDAISKKMFSDSEVKDYALWKASIYFGENFHFSPKLSRKIFEATLLKLNGYYLALSAGE